LKSNCLSNLETGRRSPSFEKTVELAKALDVPMGALFSFEQDEADPKTLKRRIETILTMATAQQLRQIYGHVRHVMES
jgi:transcriptional regulator with XRE-family HTH domain